MDLKTSLSRLRIVGIVEGISYLILLVFTIIKKMYQLPHIVRIPGMVHGILFILFCYALVAVYLDNKLKIKVCLIVFAASLLPFGNFWADKKYLNQ
jgi:integral membrane protein